MTPEQVKSLKGGEIIQHENSAMGVVVSSKLWTTRKVTDSTIRVQWMGGGSMITTPEYNGWEKLRVIDRYRIVVRPPNS